MKPIAIIPARGGSKRIPRKNIVEVNGKPMIAWTIEAALRTERFSNVFVSTDCLEIAKVATDYGAEVPFLRDEYADDFCTVSEATCYTIKKLIEKKHIQDDGHVFQLMANCPLRNSSDIESFVSFALEQDVGVISVYTPLFGSPLWAMAGENKSKAEFLSTDVLNKRSQDLKSVFLPTGAIWGAPISRLLEEGSFYTENFSVFELNWINALDIDCESELEVVKMLSAGGA